MVGDLKKKIDKAKEKALNKIKPLLDFKIIEIKND